MCGAGVMRWGGVGGVGETEVLEKNPGDVGYTLVFFEPNRTNY